ncbi:hypothetical protein [Oceanirhabdus sp. W0125-5]|uniref:hypothetical protein n=1 Tax=Oceanirhabdus sp. W0125-5 TaxID=2999116 RepID=UPI0022F2C407|nr:hypothetical protein [Oceanirhabdus sp. W0125-5]WBW99208.1 hypothetical protein OW730_10800 [Oceanirhabdus sp. W0125-5]
MSYKWNDHSDYTEKDYYYDMNSCKKQEKCCNKQKKDWDNKGGEDQYWEEKCCKKHDMSWDEKSWEDKCCKKQQDCWDNGCCSNKCSTDHNKCCEHKCCNKEDKYCDEKCCKKCDCCCETRELLKEAYKYAFRARIAILAIFEFKNPCEHREVIKYFFCKAKENVKCLYKTLEKLSWCYKKKCFCCSYEVDCFIQKAIRNTEAVEYALWDIKALCDPCCNEYEYCKAVCLYSRALEKIEDVVREIETLFKLLKKCNCKKC